MIWFILFIAVALATSIFMMVKQKKSTKEIMLFSTIVLLGFADWISIFLERKFNPNHWIASFIDWISL
ncbi:tryptophan-rich sensory protein [Croceifilum oryzae]|uniref:Tryptophan-rich sensory protein n=1 Tax=Croceifilum oryzae TaxID=1553429 RepID=A0AAJ1WTJ8_9BACL|nr:hypothetical protein [Croceifilum oryzae]MDQ0418900.1 tryptophan-rich sensory protein [Croceifilum oryzae]